MKRSCRWVVGRGRGVVGIGADKAKGEREREERYDLHTYFPASNSLVASSV